MAHLLDKKLDASEQPTMETVKINDLTEDSGNVDELDSSQINISRIQQKITSQKNSVDSKYSLVFILKMLFSSSSLWIDCSIDEEFSCGSIIILKLEISLF